MALALVAGKASAGLALSVGGTTVLQKTQQQFKATTGDYTINNKIIYTIISNALWYASANSAGAITPTNVPPNGYIAFNPIGYDGEVQGTFYVTNKSGFYCPLSGFDANTNYYSFAELDSQDDYNTNYAGFEFGFVNFVTNGAPFNGPTAYNISTKGTGTETDQSTALLYIHDDGYSYDDADYPWVYFSNYLMNGGTNDLLTYNYNVVEIRGIIKATLGIKTNAVTSTSFSLTGSGNFVYQGDPTFPWANIVKNATATLTK
jgi:hypothetical protein